MLYKFFKFAGFENPNTDSSNALNYRPCILLHCLIALAYYYIVLLTLSYYCLCLIALAD